MTRLARWPRNRLGLLAALAGVVVVAGTTAVVRADSGPPFALASMHARISHLAEFTRTRDIQPVLDRWAGKGRLNAPVLTPRAPQVIVGRLDFDAIATHHADGQLVLFVIDRRANRPYDLVWGVGPPGSHVGAGWDGRYDRLPHKYPWLSMLAERAEEGGYTDPGTAISAPAGTTGPITFEVLRRDGSDPITDPASQLMFVLGYVGDSSGAWAVRLSTPAAGR